MRKNTQTDIQKSFEYYCKGLTALEISCLVNLPHRTIQHYAYVGKWKEKRAALDELEKKRIIRAHEKELRKVIVNKKVKN
jgi:hypothetical protein